jgi:hypothetical protein
MQNELPTHEQSFLQLKVSQSDHYWGRYMAKVKTPPKRPSRQERVKGLSCHQLAGSNARAFGFFSKFFGKTQELAEFQFGV